MTSPAEQGAGGSIPAARPLRVAALIKQVPSAETLELGDDGRLRREGTSHEMNPYCRRAVSKGTELARATGGRCTVFTLGPPAAEEALREAVAWGADDAVHLCDPAFAGSDTLATSRALHAAITKEGPFDLILVGRNTIDGDTGQVGPELAQLLDLPFATGVRELSLDGEILTLRLEHDDGWETVSVALPAVLSAAERLTEPAKVDPEDRQAVSSEKIRRLSASDLGPGPWGESGSPTKVGDVHVHVHDRAGRILGGPVVSQVGQVMQILRELNALDSSGTSSRSAQPTCTETPRVRGVADWQHIVAVILEPDRDALNTELLCEAARLAVESGAQVLAFRPAGAGPQDLGRAGADEVIDLDGDPLPHDIAGELTSWAATNEPWLIVAPSTAFGREVAARTAAALDSGLVGDAIGLRIKDDRIIAAKPAFSGALVADITCTSPVQLVTVRPGVLRPPVPAPRNASTIRRTLKPISRVTRLSSSRDDDVESLALAQCVVGVGLGVDPSDYEMIRPLCDVLGAELAATRKVTDRAWMPRARQVGLTGRSIAPRLYISIGVSGKFNHMVGVRSAGTVVAINSDPAAPVFSQSDIGIVADWHEAVPLLVDALGRVPA